VAHTSYQIDSEDIASSTQIINNEKNDSKGLFIWSNSLGKKGLDYTTELNRASDIGTEAHEYFDDYLVNKVIPKSFENKEAEYCFNKFKNWWDDFSKQRIEVVFTEKSLVSVKHRYGGTLDALILLVDTNEYVLIDYKTGSNLYISYLAQAGSYSNLVLENTTITVNKFLLARFGKKDDPTDFEIREYNISDLKNSFEYFLILFEAYKTKQQIKKILKRRGTKIS